MVKTHHRDAGKSCHADADEVLIFAADGGRCDGDAAGRRSVADRCGWNTTTTAKAPNSAR